MDEIWIINKTCKSNVPLYYGNKELKLRASTVYPSRPAADLCLGGTEH